MPSHEVPSPLKRPSLASRAQSTTSVLKSPSLAAPQQNRSSTKLHKVHRPARNTSHGKNLHKLTKLTPAHPEDGVEDGGPVGKNHQRKKSTTPSTSPKSHHVKRNSSTVSLAKGHGSSSALKKKTHSDVVLKRNGSAAEVKKAERSDTYPRPPSRHGKKANGEVKQVGFQLGSPDFEEDADWTEDTGSQSPSTTRNSTRKNSAAPENVETGNGPGYIEQYHPTTMAGKRERELQQQQQQQARRPVSPPHTPQRMPSLPQKQGSESFRPPDPSAITQRLLQRHTAHQVSPEMTTVSATATPRLSGSPRTSSDSHSQPSLIAAPNLSGTEGVSRFIGSRAGGSSGNTIEDGGAFLQGRARSRRPETPPSPAIDGSKRVQSAATLGQQFNSDDSDDGERDDSPPPNRSLAFRSRPEDSRTNQKMWLSRERASLEDQQQGSDGSAPAATDDASRGEQKLAKRYEQACVEYQVVHRHRNPISDSVKRLKHQPGVAELQEKQRKAYKKRQQASSGEGANGAVKKPDYHMQNGSISSGLSRTGMKKAKATPATFQVGSHGSSHGSHTGSSEGNDIEDTLRRLWESTEMNGEY